MRGRVNASDVVRIVLMLATGGSLGSCDQPPTPSSDDAGGMSDPYCTFSAVYWLKNCESPRDNEMVVFCDELHGAQ